MADYNYISSKDKIDNAIINQFTDMLEKEKIQAMEKMWWSSKHLPELYVLARKQGYWLNIVKITDAKKLKGGSKIKLLKFGEFIPSSSSSLPETFFSDSRFYREYKEKKEIE